MIKLSDEELLVLYRNGEAGAMDQLVARYKNAICAFVYRMDRRPSDSEDIAQEVFLKVHEFRHTFDPGRKFSTWIFGIAHNICLNRVRKDKWFAFWPKESPDSDKPKEFESPGLSPRDAAEEKERAELVKKCIQALPFLQKECLVLREYENMDYKEIADVIKKPIGTVRILLYSARQNLKATLLPYIEASTKGGSNEK